MANFKTHITVSTVVGVGYGAAAYALYDVPGPVCLLAGGLCGVSGMLPDIDSGPGVPLRESLTFAAAVVSTMLANRFQTFGWTMEATILAGAIVYLTIRFVVAGLLKRYTVHRGMFHSIPAAIVFGEVAYLLATGDLPIRLYKAGGVVLGYMVHLVLDEMYSVYYVRGRMQIKKSFGTAVKLYGDKLWPNVSAYGKLALFTFLALKDQAWMEDFYRQRLEARTERWTQTVVDYSGRALGAKPSEPSPADAKQPTLGEVAQRALASLASSKTPPAQPASAGVSPNEPKPNEGGAGKGTDPDRPWLPRWASGRDWLPKTSSDTRPESRRRVQYAQENDSRCCFFLETKLMTVISAPADWVEAVSELRLPASADRRLQQLMDRNTEGQLTTDERADLESLVELSEKLSLVRAQALHLLGRKPV